MQFSSKEELLLYAAEQMSSLGYVLKEQRNIQYGIQARFHGGGRECVLRMYEGKKGVRLDLSPVRDEAVLQLFKSLEPSSPKAVKTSGAPCSEPLAPVAYPYAGSDEAGKGDYFGPLVVCAALLTEKEAKALQELGVRDSKTLTDKKISALAEAMRSMGVAHHISFVSPAKLTALHEQGRNLNDILAFLHGCAVKGLLEKQKFSRIVIDRFARESLVEAQLKSFALNILQVPRAESYLPVAAASILARDFYVKRLESLGKEYSFTFPKGASQGCIDAAKEFLHTHGQAALGQVAKTFFKTTQNL